MIRTAPGRVRIGFIAGVLACAAAAPALAQTSPAPSTPAPAPAGARVSAVEIDHTLVALPTGLRLARGRSAFRVTHRFLRPLGAGSVGDLVGDLFGLDSGARIGLEYRYGLTSRAEIGVHRTSDRTLAVFGRYGVVQQATAPVALTVFMSLEGTNNFRDEYSPAVGLVVSRALAGRVIAYAEPMFVGDTNPFEAGVDADHTLMVGLGARVLIGRSTFLVVEAAPRVAGYAPGVSHIAVAFEKLAGGHVFQINVSDSLGTTLGQLARGGAPQRDWRLGFNISRKF
ncbi:MAG: hypothetical protein FJW23_09930 [Acidimicrobiia bacterium]|nr:hypothetical protein [Acidimicrobiia bacterium]